MLSLMSLRHDLGKPDACWNDKLNDASMMFCGAIEQVRAVACEVSDNSESTGNILFGALYLLEMGKLVMDQAHSQALRERAASREEATNEA